MGGKHLLNTLIVTLALTALAQADPTSTTGQALDSQGTAIPADPSIEKATQSIREGRIDEGVILIREAAAKHPEWPPSKLILARIHFTANQAPQGRRALEQAAVEAPDDPRVYITFSALALSDGRLSDGRLSARLVQGQDLLQDGLAAGVDRRDVVAGLADRHHPAGTRHARHLVDRRRRIGEMLQGAVTSTGVKGSLGEGERRRVGYGEASGNSRGGGGGALRRRQHAGAAVDAERLTAR
jgi:hypothetical protein